MTSVQTTDSTFIERAINAATLWLIRKGNDPLSNTPMVYQYTDPPPHPSLGTTLHDIRSAAFQCCEVVIYKKKEVFKEKGLPSSICYVPYKIACMGVERELHLSFTD